jgi:hypothetical protein
MSDEMNNGEFFVGCSLGRQGDYTSLAVIQRIDWETPELYQCGYLERLKLRTSYPDICKHINALMKRSEFNEPKVFVDWTGVGKPIVDMLCDEIGQRPYAVMITGGEYVGIDSRNFKVPKRDLISNLLLHAQDERLSFADGLPFWKATLDELSRLKVKISLSGHDSYEMWREGAHDDLALALALSLWGATEHNKDKDWFFYPISGGGDDD